MRGAAPGWVLIQGTAGSGAEAGLQADQTRGCGNGGLGSGDAGAGDLQRQIAAKAGRHQPVQHRIAKAQPPVVIAQQHRCCMRRRLIAAKKGEGRGGIGVLRGATRQKQRRTGQHIYALSPGMIPGVCHLPCLAFPRRLRQWARSWPEGPKPDCFRRSACQSPPKAASPQPGLGDFSAA